MANDEMAHDYYFRGEVIEIEKTEQGFELEEPLLTQSVVVKIISGTEKNKEVTVEYQVRGTEQAEKKLSVGDTVVVDKNVLPDGTTNYYVTEPFRLPVLAVLGIIFFLATIITAGRRGLFAFVGLATTLGIIGLYIIPQISQGGSPFVV